MKIGKAIAAMVGILAVVSASGCIWPVYTYGKQGVVGDKTVNEHFAVSNSDDMNLLFGCQGAGTVEVTIQNPNGATAYHNTFSGAGQTGGTEKIGGMKGTWTVTYIFRGFSGQFGLTITQ